MVLSGVCVLTMFNYLVGTADRQNISVCNTEIYLHILNFESLILNTIQEAYLCTCRDGMVLKRKTRS